MATVVIKDGIVRGDQVAVEVEVDGVPVIVRCWLSHLNTLPNRAAKVAYVAAQAKTMIPTETTVALSGTVTA